MSAIRKAVITAAGRGTRHFPATRTVQKELFPLVDCDGVTKPVLQIVVEEALAAGVERVAVVCSPASEGPIRAHFAPVSPDLRRALASKPAALKQADHLDQYAQKLEWLLQPTPEGYGDAVLQAREFVGDEPFLLLLGDHVYVAAGPERCAQTLVRAFERVEGPLSAVSRTPADQLHLFGTVAGEPLGGTPPLYVIAEMIEKPSEETARRQLRTPGLPEGQYLTFFGTHILPPLVFDHLDERKARGLREDGEIQLTASLADLAREADYFAVEIPGERLDMGVPQGYIYTQMALAHHSPYRDSVIWDKPSSGS